MFTNCVLIVNLLVAVSSLLPYTINGRSTDAKLLLGLLRPGPAADRLATILTRWRSIAADRAARLARRSLNVLEGERASHCEIGLMFVYFCAMDGATRSGLRGSERVLALAHRMNPIRGRRITRRPPLCRGFSAGMRWWRAPWLDDARRVKGTLPKEDWDSAALAGIACAEGDAIHSAQLTRAIAMLDRQPGTSGSVAACRGRLAALLQAHETAC